MSSFLNPSPYFTSWDHFFDTIRTKEFQENEKLQEKEELLINILNETDLSKEPVNKIKEKLTKALKNIAKFILFEDSTNYVRRMCFRELDQDYIKHGQLLVTASSLNEEWLERLLNPTTVLPLDVLVVADDIVELDYWVKYFMENYTIVTKNNIDPEDDLY